MEKSKTFDYLDLTFKQDRFNDKFYAEHTFNIEIDDTNLEILQFRDRIHWHGLILEIASVISPNTSSTAVGSCYTFRLVTDFIEVK